MEKVCKTCRTVLSPSNAMPWRRICKACHREMNKKSMARARKHPAKQMLMSLKRRHKRRYRDGDTLTPAAVEALLKHWGDKSASGAEGALILEMVDREGDLTPQNVVPLTRMEAKRCASVIFETSSFKAKLAEAKDI